MAIRIEAIDHVVLTVRDIEATCEFYSRVLGLKAVGFGDGRTALSFGNQKFNLHQAGSEFAPRAQHPTPGSADLCLLASTPIDEVIRHLGDCGVDIIEGPVPKTGATGPLISVYFRDPDDNLIEVSNLAA